MSGAIPWLRILDCRKRRKQAGLLDCVCYVNSDTKLWSLDFTTVACTPKLWSSCFCILYRK